MPDLFNKLNKVRRVTNTTRRLSGRGGGRRGGGRSRRGRNGICIVTIAVVAIVGYFIINHFGWERITGLLGLNQSPSVSRPTEGEVQVHFIDVGQGDCALILSQNTAVLIDSGDSQFADFVVDYIKRMGVTELDLIITSHPHADHIGGMAKIINNIGTKRLIMPDKAHDTNTFLRMLDAIEDNNVDVGYAKAGEVIDFGNFELQIIAPVIEFDSINDSSVAVRLVHGSNSFLFTGDMETKAEDDLLERKADVSADVLKVSHHGSRTSSQRLFLDAVNGDYAVISVAEGNIHNHPNDDVLRRLEVTGYRILRTDELGTIVFISNSEGLEVSS